MAAFHDNWALAQEYLTILLGGVCVVLLIVVLSVGRDNHAVFLGCTIAAAVAAVPATILAGVRVGRMHEENRALLRN